MPIRKRNPEPVKSELRIKLEQQWQSKKIGDPSHFCRWSDNGNLIAIPGRKAGPLRKRP